MQWPDGHYQWFVVGTTGGGNVYDSWQSGSTWTNWRNLGGVARSSVEVTYLTSTRLDIRVVGTFNGYWCKRWTSTAGWGNWWDC